MIKYPFQAISVLFIQLALFSAVTFGQGHMDYYARPFPMGVSVSTTPTLPFISAGTAGMRVRSMANPNIKFILSNNHVLGAIGPDLCPDSADRWPPPLTWAIQPGTLDIGNDPGQDPFYFAGGVVNTVPLDFSGGNNFVDAAIAYTTPAQTSSEILGIGQPTPALGQATLGMNLIKSGRTTGVTTGTVLAVNSTVIVDYGDCGNARFTNQITTSASLGDSGDSGSVVLDSATLTPVGLYFAGSAATGVMNPILLVYLSLGVFVDSQIVPADGRRNLQAMVQNLSADPEIENLKAIQAKNENRVMQIPGVVGMGIGQNEAGSGLSFVVFTDGLTASAARAMPASIDGTPVRIINSGGFVAH